MAKLENHKHEMLSRSQRFYVYVIRIGGQTRYVGKGTGLRMLTHLRSSHNPTLRSEIDSARCCGVSVRARRIASSLTETQALSLERRAIGKWARSLTNVAMGSRSSAELVSMQAIAGLRSLKSEEAVRAEGAFRGISMEDRIAHLVAIKAELGRFAEAA